MRLVWGRQARRGRGGVNQGTSLGGPPIWDMSGTHVAYQGLYNNVFVHVETIGVVACVVCHTELCCVRETLHAYQYAPVAVQCRPPAQTVSSALPLPCPASLCPGAAVPCPATLPWSATLPCPGIPFVWCALPCHLRGGGRGGGPQGGGEGRGLVPSNTCIAATQPLAANQYQDNREDGVSKCPKLVKSYDPKAALHAYVSTLFVAFQLLLGLATPQPPPSGPLLTPPHS